MDINLLTEKVIGCAITVHKELGPGLLESTYESCLAYELEHSELEFSRQIPLPIQYKSIQIDCSYRLDLVVENSLLLELKSVEKLERIHEAQILTYLKLGGFFTGLLINFNVPLLKDGIKRFKM